MAMAMAACTAVDVGIITVGLAVAATTTAGAAVAGIATIGEVTTGADMRPSPALGTAATLRQRAQRNSALTQGVAGRSDGQPTCLTKALSGLAVQKRALFSAFVLKIRNGERRIDLAPERYQMSDRLLDLAIGIELQELTDALTSLVVIDEDCAVMTGIKLNEFEDRARFRTERLTPIGGNIDDAVKQCRGSAQQRAGDCNACVFRIKVGHALKVIRFASVEPINGASDDVDVGHSGLHKS